MASLDVPLAIDEGHDPSVALFDYFREQQWGDGLPIIAPTPERVDAMIAGIRAPDEVVATLAPTESEATVEMVAANAVMAGCRPSHFPLVLAAVEAVADPRYNLRALNTTTNPVAPMVLVNGPMRRDLDLNGSWSVLGPSYHGNAAIGRALSLCMMNIAGRTPGTICKGTYKTPGAFTMCAAEYEEESPWEPLHVERGFGPDESTVTVIAVCGVSNLIDVWSLDGEDLAKSLAYMMSVQQGENYIAMGRGEIGLMVSPGHAKVLAQAFKTKAELQRFVHDHARIPHGWVTSHRAKTLKARGEWQEDERGVFVSGRPEQWLVFVAGGLGGYHSAYIHTFGDSYVSMRRVER